MTRTCNEELKNNRKHTPKCDNCEVIIYQNAFNSHDVQRERTSQG